MMARANGPELLVTISKCHPERSGGSKVPGNMVLTPLAIVYYCVTVMLIHGVLRAQDLDSSVASLLRNDMDRYEIVT